MKLTVIIALCMINEFVRSQSLQEIREAVLAARKYFILEARQNSEDTPMNWMANSGKIGSGFDTVAGSPVCYTGQCQMEGFRRALFRLVLNKRSKGSCIDIVIPQNVELDCLPSMQMSAKTETIATMTQLQDSTKRGYDASVSAEGFGNSLSYRFSHEIRSMIDTLVEHNSTIYFTRVTVTWARLFAFVPALQLSEAFHFVIENMPCCNESLELDHYIREFVIDYFGLTYVKDMLLGGIAQQQVTISDESRKKIQSNSVSTSHALEAKFAYAIFSASAKFGISDNVDRTQTETFKKYSHQSSITTLGGTPNILTIEEWAKTVPSNPTIVKFSLSNILDLLTPKRFPSDPDIRQKQYLVKKAHEKYINNPVFCYNNCSGHGTCIPSGYFGMGKCNCYLGRTGIDCATVLRIPSGVLTIGYSKDDCPKGFKHEIRLFGVYNYPVDPSGDNLKTLPGCSAVGDDTSVGPIGTLCGLDFLDMHIPCNGLYPIGEPCPPGFTKVIRTQYGLWPTTLWTCKKNVTDAFDFPGTLCGFQSTLNSMTQFGGSHVWCGGYDPGQGKCPPGFTHYQKRLPNELGGLTIYLCAKT